MFRDRECTPQHCAAIPVLYKKKKRERARIHFAFGANNEYRFRLKYKSVWVRIRSAGSDEIAWEQGSQGNPTLAWPRDFPGLAGSGLLPGSKGD